MKNTIRNLTIAAVGAAAAAAIYAWLVEPRWLQRTRTTLHHARLPPALEGLRIGLLTDLHASRDTPVGLIARAVQMTMAEAPDMIAITGDIAEDEASLEVTLDELAALRAPLGVYIVPGNHDYRDVGIERWHDAVSRRPSLIDLTNDARFLELPAHTPSGGAGGIGAGGRVGGIGAGGNSGGNGADRSGIGIEGNGAGGGTGAHADDTIRLCIAGVDDLAEGRPNLNALHDVTRRDFTILLAHNPDQAEHARRSVDRVDLVISGHTHGGQVRLPGVGAIVNSAEHADLYEAGLRRRPWTQVYTSRGVGTVHLPVRFLTRPEIAILTLTGAPRSRR